MARDPYLELGVSRTASAAEIRKAFHKLAKQHHPDANKGDKKSEEKFKQVSAAFDILGDADKRKKFDAGEIDADGRETMRGGFGGGGNPFGAGFGGRGGGFRSSGGGEGPEIDLNDLFGDILGRNRGAGAGAGGGFGGGGFAAKGADVRARLDIDLEEAIKGGKKRVAFSDGRTIDVTIPAGAQEGQTLRLKGQGSPGRGGQGDALIELAIKPHPIYRPENGALVMDLPVSVPDAVLGGKVEAPTPDGPVTLTVPKGSNTGAKLRLKGRGLSDAKGHRGDLFARLVVTLPETPDAELEKFAETWREKRPYAPKRR
ncbi:MULTISPECIES: DnaJ C-terminal domain-containing protein [Caulobacter]|uniref:DnaJ C-terminal domain-containing protein n=1 Tax=Caulobacter TaxID=75 RepID=UPI0006F21D74|nr:MULTISPECIES: DnaJ C-terminal domain-containing protein [Caulobacter]KQZ31399.1 molecular chaperone DnaJ [Caulobacter sp. Root1472]GGL45077.1 molecular chaperone DnaJ [Caulobacter rhizosphaerae]